MVGSSLGQAITLLFYPVLTRLYEPSDFAVYAVFMAFLNSLSPGISGRYEIAVAVAPGPKESKSLVSFAFLVTAVLSCLIFLFILFFESQTSSILNIETIGNFVYLVPVALFLIGVKEIMRRYSNFQKNYKIISYNAILQSAIAAFAACVFSLMGLNKVGLILSFLLATFFCTVAFFWNYKNDINFAKLKITKSKFKLAYKYRQFPLLNAPASILNGITLALPVFFLARDYPEAILGYYALMTRVMMSPLSLIPSSGLYGDNPLSFI